MGGRDRASVPGRGNSMRRVAERGERAVMFRSLCLLWNYLNEPFKEMGLEVTASTQLATICKSCPIDTNFQKIDVYRYRKILSLHFTHKCYVFFLKTFLLLYHIYKCRKISIMKVSLASMVTSTWLFHSIWAPHSPPNPFSCAILFWSEYKASFSHMK